MARTSDTASADFEIKVVGKSGQISLGKRFAGKVLRLDRLEDGSILLTPVAIVPESHLRLLHLGGSGAEFPYPDEPPAAEPGPELE